MKFPNNDILRQMLTKAGEHDLAQQDGFDLDQCEFESHQLEVFSQHAATHSAGEINARAAFRCLTHASKRADVRGSSLEARDPSRTLTPPTCPATPRTSNLEPLTKTICSCLTWRPLQIAWGIMILALLGAIAAHCQEAPAGMPALPKNAARGDTLIRAALRSSLFADQVGGIIIQVQNQGAVLATRPAGLLVLNCSTNMSCSFAGATFTMTASSSAGTSWSSLTNPTGSLSLAMAANATTMTWNAATGASNLFNLTDTTNNTGTGFIFSINLASGSAAKPAQFAVNGNGVSVTNAGLLTKVGTGGLDWTAHSNFPSACGANNFVTGVAATLSCAQPAFSNLSGAATEGQLPSATVFTDQNATFGAHTYDFTAATLLKVRVASGLTTSANGDFGYDSSSANNWHGWNNGADLIFPMVLSSTPVNNDCVKWVVSLSNIRLGDTGAACGSGGGGTTINVNGAALAGTTGNFGNTPAAPAGDLLVTWQKDSGNPTTNVSGYLPPFVASGASHAPGLVPDPGSTAGVAKFLREDATFVNPVECAVSSPVTVTATGAQNLQTCTLGSGDLNTVGKWLHIYAQGVASTAATGAGNVTISVQLAGTAVCASNTTSLNTSKTNVGWLLSCDMVVVTAGASGSVEAQGWMTAQSLWTATNPFVMSNTAAITVNTTGTPQVAVVVNLSATGNSWTERLQLDRISN